VIIVAEYEGFVTMADKRRKKNVGFGFATVEI
jgi:hypothetical protein